MRDALEGDGQHREGFEDGSRNEKVTDRKRLRRGEESHYREEHGRTSLESEKDAQRGDDQREDAVDEGVGSEGRHDGRRRRRSGRLEVPYETKTDDAARDQDETQQCEAHVQTFRMGRAATSTGISFTFVRGRHKLAP